MCNFYNISSNYIDRAIDGYYCKQATFIDFKCVSKSMLPQSSVKIITFNLLARNINNVTPVILAFRNYLKP